MQLLITCLLTFIVGFIFTFFSEDIERKFKRNKK
jgi:hypothetical protein